MCVYILYSNHYNWAADRWKFDYNNKINSSMKISHYNLIFLTFNTKYFRVLGDKCVQENHSNPLLILFRS